PFLDQVLVGQLLVALEDRERIDPVLGRDLAHRWQRVALLEHAVEDPRHDQVAKLPVDRLTVVPLGVHAARLRFVSGSVSLVRSRVTVHHNAKAESRGASPGLPAPPRRSPRSRRVDAAARRGYARKTANPRSYGDTEMKRSIALLLPALLLAGSVHAYGPRG